MKLYGFFASPYVARVELFARLKGIELTTAVPLGDGIKSAESMAANPIGKMPYLETERGTLAESSVICEYIEDAAGGKAGLPADAFERATARLIARVTDLYVSAHVSPLFGQLRAAEQDEAVIQAAADGLAQANGYLEHFMAAGPFASGAAPSIGDCALAPFIVLMQQTVYPNFAAIEDPTKQPGRLQDWWQAIENDSILGPGMAEYDSAFKEFVKMLTGRG